MAKPVNPTPRTSERAFALLDLVAGSDGVTLSDAARAVELSPSTALRHLRSLETAGYVDRDDDGRYRIGTSLVRLALTVIENAPTARLAERAVPFLARLEAATHETSYLAVVETDAHAVYLASHEARRSIRHVSWAGSRVPLEGTAVGEALRSEPGTVVVRVGAVEPDVTAVAAPVFDGVEVVGALAVIGPSFRLEGEVLARAEETVGHTAAELGATLDVTRRNA